MSELREKLKKIPEMFLYQRYIDNKLAEDFILDLCKYVDRINTLKHETVEEYKERTGKQFSHDSIVYVFIEPEDVLGEWDFMRYRKAINLGYMDDETIVVKENHGKPEEHNV